MSYHKESLNGYNAIAGQYVHIGVYIKFKVLKITAIPANIIIIIIRLLFWHVLRSYHQSRNNDLRNKANTLQPCHPIQ